MTENKATVGRYLECFNTGDREKILSCLTDDVEWLIPGFFHVHGKEEFGGRITNDAFVGLPNVTIGRLTEEDDVVICEGTIEPPAPMVASWLRCSATCSRCVMG